MCKESGESELDKILGRTADSVVKEVQSEYLRVIGQFGEQFVLFGAGPLGKYVLGGLRSAGIEPLAFADNNPVLWNKTVNGLRVLSPEDAVTEFARKAVFVITIYTMEPVRKQLTALGATFIPFAMLAWGQPEALTPHGALELPHKIFAEAEEVRRGLSVWADAASRTEYVAQIKWRTSLDPRVLPPHQPPDRIYFPDDLFQLSSEEVFVDCGAFDGDSVRTFLERQRPSFKQVVAIEGDPNNFQRLSEYFASLPDDVRTKMMGLQFAVGSRHEIVHFNATGTAASSVGAGSLEVQSAPMDDMLGEIIPTFIKMDIEGAEMDALSGSRGIIRDQLPILAICLYHKQEDLWRIPLFIRSLSPDYSLFLRRYCGECWELVCYAVPKHRLLVREQ